VIVTWPTTALSVLIFSIPEVIAAASRHITLEPGDIVTTGTPAGVGVFAEPPRYLQPGDEVITTVSRVGSITNPVIAGWQT
jgi:2-keto-4-pentenoate hydratase/2-oxohepta-3-ene-1,7-dioic acid hydratase in catechol pathway